MVKALDMCSRASYIVLLRIGDSQPTEATVASEDKNSELGVSLALGVGIGTAIGAAVGDIAVGIAIGAAIGLCFGAASSKNEPKG
jgi:hypothetical protein